MKLTKRQFRNRIIKRNVKIAITLSVIVSTVASIEFETKLTWIILWSIVFTWAIVGITVMWSDLEGEQAYKEYEDDYVQKNNEG